MLHRHLASSGCEIIEEPDDGMLMLVADPDGLVLEIWQRESG